jgi:gustatory receptor
MSAFSKLPFPINAVYFWYSMLFLIARTSAMFFIASSINDEAKKPLKILRTIPNSGWFSSTQRFSKQVQNDCIALSGKKFFHITRGIIISIAGTIVTYELVLLQFDADKIESIMFNPCPKPEYIN